jgi:hypothetical protein
MHEDVAGTTTAASTERTYWLGVERELAARHRALASSLKRIQALDVVEVEAPLQSALWALGVAVLQAAHQVQRASEAADRRT